MPDGSTTVEFFWQDEVSDTESCAPVCLVSANWHAKLYLMTIQPDGSSTTQVLDSTDIVVSPTTGPMSGLYSEPNLYYIPGEIIPDGQGGLLASWSKAELDGTLQSMMTHVDGGSATTFSSLDTGSVGTVLGDNDTAFAPSETGLYAFDVNSGSVKWTYSPPADGENLTIIAASDGGGVVAKSTVNGVDTIINFDASGNPTTDPLTGSELSYSVGDLWLGQRATAGTRTPTGLTGNPIQWAQSVWAKQGIYTRNPEPKVQLRATIVDAVSSITGTGVDPNVVTSQVNAAIRQWQLEAYILLDWDGTVRHVPPCVSGDSDCDDDSLAEITNTSIQQIPVRFTNLSGADLIFTLDISVTRFGQNVTPEGITLVWVNSGRFMNKSGFNANPGSTPVAHELGHQFQLPHIPDKTNLMCGPSNLAQVAILNCDPDVAVQLTNDQIQSARRGRSSLIE